MFLRLTARDTGLRLSGVATNYAAMEGLRGRFESSGLFDRVNTVESKTGDTESFSVWRRHGKNKIWWQARNPRDRRALLILAVVVPVVLFWFFVTRPLEDRLKLSRRVLEKPVVTRPKNCRKTGRVW